LKSSSALLCCAVIMVLYSTCAFSADNLQRNLLSQRNIVFSPEEQEWLNKHKAVTFTGDPNWLPYEAFTESGEYIGIVASHLDLISQRTGLIFKMSPSKTWTESTQKAKKGQVDILSETDDSDLKSHLTFTKSYLSNPIVIAMRINENYVEKIDVIKDRKIGLIKDYGYAPKIRRKYPYIRFVTVENIQDGLISLSTGKIDALICTLALCSYTIHELGLNDVKITGKTEFDTKLALGVQKNNPVLLSILNKAIDTISEGEQQVILDEWIKHDYIEKVNYTLVYIVASVSIILLSLFYYWNRRLTGEVRLRKRAEKELILSSETNERYRVLFYESPVGHALNQMSTGKFLSVNEGFSKITGYSLDELNELSYWDLTPFRYQQHEQEQIESLNKSGKYGPYEKHYIHKSGKLVAVRLNGSLITDKNGDKLILSVVEDISAFSEVKEKLRLNSLVLENSSEAMMITDHENRIVAVNPAFTSTTGYTLEEVKGKDPATFKSGRHNEEFYQEMWESIDKTGQWQGEIWDKKKNGDIYAKFLTIDTIKDENGVISRYVALFSDITEKKKNEEIIWWQANYDELTGLPNRSQFQQKLRDEIKRSTRDNLSFALLLLDLDTFKEVNDTLGHDRGDMLLKIAANRIGHCIRGSDTVARLGGDEFTIILPGVSKQKDIDSFSSKLISKLSEPYNLGDEVVHISASIGVTIFPEDATSIEALVKNADQAMYVSKNRGRNRFSRFTHSLQEAAQKKLRISNDLRKAIENNEFTVHYQPIINLTTNRIAKAEALLRWNHPSVGLISPRDFIPVAEEIGVITEIGDWVFKEVQKDQDIWSTAGHADISVSINMSPVQFKVPVKEFGRNWLYGNRKKNFSVEITEGLLLNSEPETLKKLYLLRDAGIEVSIDDFGTGYSSLSYLKEFDIDYLKIDQSFVRNLENDLNDVTLSEAIIVMAHKLGLKVIAEGVENITQHKILAAAGCDYAQGNVYSCPVPAKQFEALVGFFPFATYSKNAPSAVVS